MIRFENIVKSFGKRTILKGVNLEIERGKTTVIFGVSGGGKSTIIKHMVGLLRPDSGSIIVDGVLLENADENALREIRKKVGFLFQHGALFDSMNIRDNVAFPMIEHQKLTPKELEYKIDEKLTMVGLEANVVNLISLTEDARRDVSVELAEAMTRRYIAARRAEDARFDEEAFRFAAALLATQRNTKIVGIFARLLKRDHKPRYTQFLPRMWGYLARDLNHPALAPLKAWFDRHVPQAWRGTLGN